MELIIENLENVEKNEEIEKKIIKNVSEELNLSLNQIKNTMKLFDEGASIPFIARYRKELTNNLDEEKIEEIINKTEYFRNLEKRKLEVIRLIEEQDKLTPELRESIEKAKKLQEVEDLYLPYKKKKKTKADIAIENGLEPLLHLFLNENINLMELSNKAREFLNEEIKEIKDAIDGVKLILAQYLSESIKIREFLRQELMNYAIMISKLNEKMKENDIKKVYQDYYDFSEPLKKLPSYRILAINRGEKEKILKVDVEVEENKYDEIINKIFNIYFITDVEKKSIKNINIKTEEQEIRKFLIEIIEDSLKRLIMPSIKNEIRSNLKEKAEEEAINNFSKNLKNLLLQPPLDKKTVLGLDPGYRTGCKMAVIDKNGFYIENDVLYLVEGMHTEKQLLESKKKILNMIDKYNVDIIAIGNGTASRETESFVAKCIKETDKEVSYIIVNEAGASVYSASKLAQEEFPDLDVTVRGTISIARRIQDPLSELVKIDPKSIGVGMYQHDVNQKKLQESLELSIENIVNKVGVNINTASFELLKYVSGVKKNVAKNIEKYRKDNGNFKNREEIKKVKGLGEKVFEQMVGFVVIPDSDNPLDNTIIHPESYHIAEEILKMYDSNLEELKENILEVRKKLKKAKIEDILKKHKEYGYETTKDILNALIEDRRDPREDIEKPILRSDILKMEDLKEGMILEGTVRNVMPFGAFVDIGLKNMGLVHISEISNKFVKNSTDVISIGEIVKVKIISIDIERERIGLSIKQVN